MITNNYPKRFENCPSCPSCPSYNTADQVSWNALSHQNHHKRFERLPILPILQHSQSSEWNVLTPWHPGVKEVEKLPILPILPIMILWLLSWSAACVWAEHQHWVNFRLTVMELSMSMSLTRACCKIHVYCISQRVSLGYLKQALHIFQECWISCKLFPAHIIFLFSRIHHFIPWYLHCAASIHSSQSKHSVLGKFFFFVSVPTRTACLSAESGCTKFKGWRLIPAITLPASKY